MAKKKAAVTKRQAKKEQEREEKAKADDQSMLKKVLDKVDGVAEEQAKRIEEEIARKKRAKRPKWRCAICGLPHCKVAPYIEGYEDVDL